MLCEAMIVLIFAFYYLKEYLIIKNINIKKLSEYTKYSLPLIPHALSFSLLNIGDRIIMQMYLSLQIVGVYHVGYQIGFAFHLISKGFSRAFNPNFMKAIKHYEKENSLNKFLIQYVNTTVPKIIMIGAIINIIYSLWIKEIFNIFINNSVYYPAYKITIIVLLAMYITFLQSLYLPILHYKKKSIAIAFSTMISVAINIILNILLIPKYGMISAAYSTLIACTFRLLCLLIFNSSYFIMSFTYIKYILIILFLPLYYIFFISFIIAEDFNFNYMNFLWKIPLSMLFLYYSYVCWMKLQLDNDWLKFSK